MSDQSDVILERMMSLHPKIMDLTLGRMHQILERLGNPERKLPPVIHIAGTNGKGSTLAMIRAGLEADGKRVHAYTSPHLVRFHERIRVAGELIDEEALSELLSECETRNLGEQITYFEITTAAALLAFSRVQADYTLLEVGLGGRLDATNVVDKPALTVITPVDLDHQQYLGETIDQIAFEKAGILKRGVTGIVAPQADHAREVIEQRALEVGAPLRVHGQDWTVWTERDRLVFQDDASLMDLPMPNLRGPHQITNAGTAIAALRTLGVSDASVEAAPVKAEWPARLQRLRTGPLLEQAPRAEFWLDGGHNPAAAQVLTEALRAMPPKRLFMICGMLNTKDLAGYLRPFASICDHLWGVSIPDTTATLPADETTRVAEDCGIPATISGSVEEAVAQIVASGAPARILICGSLYLAGHILKDHAEASVGPCTLAIVSEVVSITTSPDDMATLLRRSHLKGNPVLLRICNGSFF